MHENPLAHASASPSVGILKEGTLFKLGGQHRDKWQARRFRLTDSSLEWEAIDVGSAQLPFTRGGAVPCDHIVSVAVWSGRPNVPGFGFEVATRVKDNKVYKLCATTAEARDSWIAALQTAESAAAGAFFAAEPLTASPSRTTTDPTTLSRPASLLSRILGLLRWFVYPSERSVTDGPGTYGQPNYDDPRDARFIEGSLVEEGKPYQDYPWNRLVILGVQHTFAVLFTVCVPVAIVVNAGLCRCQDGSHPARCTQGLTKENWQQYVITNTSDPRYPHSVVNAATCFVKDDHDANYMISMAVVMSGVSTILQSGKIAMLGSNLLSIMGTSFAYVPALIDSGISGGPEKGLGVMMTMCILTCWLEPAIAYLPPSVMRLLQHPTILGTVVILIGTSLSGNAMLEWAGHGFNGGGSMLNLLLGLLSVISMGLLTRFGGEGYIKNISILVTICVGFFVSVVLDVVAGDALAAAEGRINAQGCHPTPGMQKALEQYAQPPGKGKIEISPCAPIVNFQNLEAPVKNGEWFFLQYPQFGLFPFGVHLPASGEFWALFGAWMVATLSSTLESMGDITATAQLSGKVVDGPYFAHRLRGGLNMDAFGGFFSALVGAMPNTTYSENNGLIAMTRVHDYRCGMVAGLIMVIIGAFPPFAGFVRSVPGPVMGGLLVVLFTMVAVSGVRMVAEPRPDDVARFKAGELEELPLVLANPRNQFVLAAAVGIGLGTHMNSFSLNHSTLGYASAINDPSDRSVQLLLSNGVSIGALTAIVLNLLIPEQQKRSPTEDLKHIVSCGCVREQLRNGDTNGSTANR